MQPSRFVGFAYNIGDPITFKMLQCNIDPHKRNFEVHRDILVPCNSVAVGYNSAIGPKIDANFQEVHLEDGPPIKLATP